MKDLVMQMQIFQRNVFGNDINFYCNFNFKHYFLQIVAICWCYTSTRHITQ